MNCTHAREVLDILIDGGQHLRAEEARRHLAECADCREWHAGIERSLLLLESIRDDVPEADISAAVMASLPACHPASARRPQTDALRRVIAWVGVSWAVGAVMLVALLAAGLWLGARHADGVYRLLHVMFSTATDLTGAATETLTGLGDVLVVLLALVVPSAVLGAVMLAAVLIIWRSRRRVTGTHVVLF